jgi:hypothetical protein
MELTREDKMVKVGTTFHAPFQDANPLWEVIESKGNGCWTCRVVGCPDYSGTQKLFSTSEITSILETAAAYKQVALDNDRWYKNLTVGSIVHYNNGFNNYVRCEVVRGVYNSSFESKKTTKVENHLLPIALVGDWKPYDLPKRRLDGTIELGYYAQHIVDKELMHPHTSSIYECTGRGLDPRELEPISLEVPPVSDEAARIAKLVRACNAVREVVTYEQADAEYLKNCLLSAKTIIETAFEAA